MKNLHIVEFLRTIARKAPIDELQMRGFTLLQVTELIAQSEREDFLEWENRQPRLTSKAIEFLQNHNVQEESRGWIEYYYVPEQNTKEIFDTYIPSRAILSKLTRWVKR